MGHWTESSYRRGVIAVAHHQGLGPQPMAADGPVAVGFARFSHDWVLASGQETGGGLHASLNDSAKPCPSSFDAEPPDMLSSVKERRSTNGR
jgi:hypothetical protein